MISFLKLFKKKIFFGTNKNKTAYSHFSKQRKLAPTKFHKIAQLQLRSNVNWNGVNDLSYKTHVFTFFLVKVCAKLSYGYNDNYRWFTILINDNIEWATIDRKIPRACGSGELKMSFTNKKRISCLQTFISHNGIFQTPSCSMFKYMLPWNWIKTNLHSFNVHV